MGWCGLTFLGAGPRVFSCAGANVTSPGVGPNPRPPRRTAAFVRSAHGGEDLRWRASTTSVQTQHPPDKPTSGAFPTASDTGSRASSEARCPGRMRAWRSHHEPPPPGRSHPPRLHLHHTRDTQAASRSRRGHRPTAPGAASARPFTTLGFKELQKILSAARPPSPKAQVQEAGKSVKNALKMVSLMKK